MPRRPTDREKALARAQARKDEAAAALASSVERAALDPDALAAHLRFRALFRAYSFRNTLLLAEQARQRGTSARFFKGYRAWQDAGRQVRKGERGYQVFAPVVRTLTGDQAREAQVEDGERAVVAYRVATVFDIDQTDVIDGHEDRAPVYVSPIPQLAGSDFADLRADLERVAADLGYQVVVYAAHARRAGGFCDPARKRIGLKRAAPDQQAAVLAHELAHALAHTGPQAADLSQHVREIQAEGAAYLACYALGLDMSRATLPYLREWCPGDTAEDRRAAILAQLTAIDRIAWQIVEKVESVHDEPQVQPNEQGRGDAPPLRLAA